jgi:hypothetical protein
MLTEFNCLLSDANRYQKWQLLFKYIKKVDRYWGMVAGNFVSKSFLKVMQYLLFLPNLQIMFSPSL